MHDIIMESHISTNVEGPSHYIDAIALKEGIGKDLSQLSLTSYFGEAVLARKRLEGMLLHKMMCEKDIPIIEILANLERLKKTRFFLFSWTAYLAGLELFPIRAVAFEPLDET